MKVLILPSEPYLTIDFPLGGVFQRDQAVSLKKYGHDVRIISVAQYPTSFFLRQISYEKVEESSFTVLRRYIKKLIPERLASAERIGGRLYSIALQLFHALAETGWMPDIIHAHNVRYAGIVARALSFATGIPFVITEHNSMYTTDSVPHHHVPVIRCAANDCGEVLFVSEYLRENFRKTTGILRKGIIVPNVLDERFEMLPIGSTMPDRVPSIIAAGSLDDNKNFSALIRAFARGFHDRPARLTIAGTGPKKKALESLAKTLGVQDRVVFPGLLDRENLIAAMDNSDCLAVTSRTETFGVVAIEALARGLRIVTTRCGGTEEVAVRGCGVVVDQDDEESLACALRSESEVRNSKIRASIREKAVLEYGQDAFASRLTDIYRKVLVKNDSSH